MYIYNPQLALTGTEMEFPHFSMASFSFHQNKARFRRLHQMSRRRPQQHDRPGAGDFLWLLIIENIVMKQIW